MTTDSLPPTPATTPPVDAGPITIAEALSRLREIGKRLPTGYWLTAEILSVGGERWKLITELVAHSPPVPAPVPQAPAHGSQSGEGHANKPSGATVRLGQPLPARPSWVTDPSLPIEWRYLSNGRES